MKSLTAFVTSAFICLQCSVGYAATRIATLNVPGMDCAACPITIKKALSRVDGVSDVKVSFEKKQATVTFDDTRTSTESLTHATNDAGFPSTVEGSAK